MGLGEDHEDEEQYGCNGSHKRNRRELAERSVHGGDNPGTINGKSLDITVIPVRNNYH